MFWKIAIWVVIATAICFGVGKIISRIKIKKAATIEDIDIAYIGPEELRRKNKRNTIILFIIYPLLALFLFVFLGGALLGFVGGVLAFVAFVIYSCVLYRQHSTMISKATRSRPLERNENKEVYNLLENLCISSNVEPMPRLCIIEDDETLNAFASGIKKEDYTITLTTGIIAKLNTEELQGVMAHELSHINNGDVKLMTLSLVFNGIYGMIPSATRTAVFGAAKYFNKLIKNGRDNAIGAVLGLYGVVIVIVYGFMFWLFSLIVKFISLVTHFAISRKREYMADAGAVQLTNNTAALASALRKISGHDYIVSVKNADLAAMFISNPCVNLNDESEKKGKLNDIFRNIFFLDDLTATHPDIRVRIRRLEQM